MLSSRLIKYSFVLSLTNSAILFSISEITSSVVSVVFDSAFFIIVLIYAWLTTIPCFCRISSAISLADLKEFARIVSFAAGVSFIIDLPSLCKNHNYYICKDIKVGAPKPIASDPPIFKIRILNLPLAIYSINYAILIFVPIYTFYYNNTPTKNIKY